MTKFGETLRKIRIEKGMKQEELAERTGLTQAAISQFEKGLRVPTPAKVKLFAEVLEISQDQFFPDPEHERKSLMRKLNKMTAREIKELDTFAGYLIRKKEDDK